MQQSPVIHDVPEELVTFIRTIITSYVIWDLLTFFYDTRGVLNVDTEDIASSIGREEAAIRPALEHLCKHEVLQKLEEHTRIIYSPYQNNKWGKVIHAFFDFTSTKEGRLKTIYLITAQGSPGQGVTL